MVLSSLPCNDAENQCNGNNSKSETKFHQHNEDSDDNCSPFCICNCCHTVLASLDFIPFEIKQSKVVVVSQKIAPRNYTLISNYYSSIWDPPKFKA